MKAFIKTIKRIFKRISDFRFTNFLERQKGGISIFLVGCMLPILAITGILIDATRFSLARGIIASAEDLALNTVLAEYHGELQDWYGLMGAQGKTEDAEKALNASVTYTPAGGSSWVTGAASGGGGSLIPISVNEATVAPIEGANLGNPAILHAQIVEFMKYRAPINLVTTIFETVSVASEDSAEAAANARLVQEQNDTYEAMQELIDKVDELLEKVNEYEDLALTEEYINNIVKKYSDEETVDGERTYRGEYKELHTQRVFQWQEMEDYISVANNSHISFKDFTTVDVPSADVADLESALAALMVSFEAQAMLYAEMELELHKYGQLKQWSTSYGHDHSRWAVQVYEAIVRNNKYLAYRGAVNNTEFIYDSLIEHLDEEIEAGESGTGEEAETGTGGEEIDFSSVAFIEFKLSPDNTTIVEDWSTLTNIPGIDLADFKDELESRFKDGINKKYTGRTSNVDKIFAQAKARFTTSNNFSASPSQVSTMANIDSELTEFHEKSDTAQDVLDDMISIANELIGLVEKYQEERDEWEAEVATDQGTDVVVEAHYDELYGLDNNELINTALELTVQDATDFSDHVEKLRDMFKDNKDVIDAFRYGNSKIMDIDTKDKFMNAVNDSAINIPDMMTEDYRDLEDLNNINTTTFRELWEHPEDWASIVFDEPNNTHPDLNRPVNNLYEFVKEYEEKYKVHDEDSSTKNAWEDFQKILDDISLDILPNEIVEASVVAGSVEDAPHNLVDRIFGDSSEETAEVAELGEIGTISAIRDNLFILDYMFSMFSYDTLRTETFTAFHEFTNVSEAKDGFEEKKENWMVSDDTYNYVNRNLRNQFLAPAREFPDGQETFGSETEYIVFGLGSMGSQYAAYASIMAIRVAFNVLPVFMWIMRGPASDGLPGAVRAMANAVGAIFPVGRAIVYAFAIFLVTVLETLMDMNALKYGLSAPLVKKPDRTGDSLTIKEKWGSFMGGADGNDILTRDGGTPSIDTVDDFSPPKTSDGPTISDESSTHKGESGKNFNPNDWYYSTYLMLFGFMGLTFSHGDVVERIGNQIAFNLSIDDLSELNTAYSLTGTAKLDSMFDLTGIVGERLSPWNYEFSLEKGY